MSPGELNRILRQLDSTDPRHAQEVEWLSTAAVLARCFSGGTEADVLCARQEALASFGLCPPPFSSQGGAVELGRRALAGESGDLEAQIRLVLSPLPIES